jgi:HTH-type transcriptional regulator / antitoxin HigA
MDIRPIKTEADYEAALLEIDGLMDAEADTPEGDRLDVLVTLVQAYEARHHPIDYPDPVEAIKVHMGTTGRTQRDLADLIGAPRASEILNRKRHLTLEMVWDLHQARKIPAEVLVRPYELARAAAAAAAPAAYAHAGDQPDAGTPSKRPSMRK